MLRAAYSAPSTVIAELKRSAKIMSAKPKRFIVISIGGTGGYGYDEQTLPVLLRLAESHNPDHWVSINTGIVSHFRTSKRNFLAVQKLVAEVESLKISDPRFSDLKIGVAEGELIGDFDWLGRLKTAGISLLGDTINEAVRASSKASDYQAALHTISERIK